MMIERKIDKTEHTSNDDFKKIQKFFPVIRFMNAIKKSNSEKNPGKYD